MVNAAIEEATARMQTLSPAQQQEVLDFIQSRQADVPPTKTPPGVPGTTWQQFEGLWTPEEAEGMLRASEECRQVDLSEW